MKRFTASVIAGYLTMFALVFATILAAYTAVGAEGAFKPGSYDVTAGWLLGTSALGLGAALAGGFVCARIARRGSRAPAALAGMTLILGLAMAVPVLAADEPPALRPPEATALCAMRDARTPPVASLLNPVIGAIGVMGGAAAYVRRTQAAK